MDTRVESTFKESLEADQRYSEHGILFPPEQDL